MRRLSVLALLLATGGLAACSVSTQGAGLPAITASPTASAPPVTSSPVASPTAAPSSTASGRSAQSLPTASAPPAGGYSNPDEVIAALAAQGISCESPMREHLTDDELSYESEATSCALNGTDTVDVAWFGTSAQRSRYLALAQSGKGRHPHCAVGTTWAVATVGRATAQQVAGAIGGTVY